MCTLSYLPNSNGFFLVNNRDESPERAAAIEPRIFIENGIRILAPIDAEAKGTWIGINEKGRFICLMNGAFEIHVRKDFYRKSRGLVAKEFLTVANTTRYFEDYFFEEIEPFTIVKIEDKEMVEYRWDGVKKHVKELDNNRAQIWSSATLYGKDIANQRAQYFEKHKSLFNKEPYRIIEWHKNQIADAPSILLKREKVQTVSLTTVSKNTQALEMSYEDLLQNKTFTKKIEL